MTPQSQEYRSGNEEGSTAGTLSAPNLLLPCAFEQRARDMELMKTIKEMVKKDRLRSLGEKERERKRLFRKSGLSKIAFAKQYAEEEAAIRYKLLSKSALELRDELLEELRQQHEALRIKPGDVQPLPNTQPTNGPSQIRYGSKWLPAKRAAIKRSGMICERCHQSSAVHIHHKMPVRFFADVDDAHFAENLMAVCKPCHTLEHIEIRANLPLLHAALSWRTVKQAHRRDDWSKS